jgi:predicted HTH transcriptional regulator
MEAISTLIKHGKNKFIDFIPTCENPHHSAALISSFANREGGTLVVGVNSKGKLIGVLPEMELQWLNEVIQYYLSTAIQIEIEEVIEKFKFAIFIHIKESESKFCGAIDLNGEPHHFVRTHKGEVFESTFIIEKSWVYHQKDSLFSEEIFVALKKLLQNQNQLTLASIFKEIGFKKSETENTLAILIDQKIIDFEFVNQKVCYYWVGNS